MPGKRTDKEIEVQLKNFVRRLREERRRVGISQMDLSLMAGLSQNQVFCIESGRRIPNLTTILKLCKALHIDPADLFKNTDAERLEARETIINLIKKYV
jgi:transcriptional regulator with XRE-family HTH domain